jgi:hypothetical protein
VIITLTVLPLIRREPSTRQRKVIVRTTPARPVALRSLDPRAVLVALEPEATLLVASHVARMAFLSLIALRDVSDLVGRKHVRERRLHFMRFGGVGRHAVDFAVGVGCALLVIGAVGLDVPETVLGAHEDGRGVGLALECIRFAGVGGEEVGFLDAAGFAAVGGAGVVAEFAFGAGRLENPLFVGVEVLDLVVFAAVCGGIVVVSWVVVYKRGTNAAVERRAAERTLLRLGAIFDLLPVSMVTANLEGGGAVVAGAAVDVGYRALLGLGNKSLTVAPINHVGLSKAQSRPGTLLGRLPVAFSAASLKGVTGAADVISN